MTRIVRVICLLSVLLCATARSAAAQIPDKAPIGPFVADIRGSFVPFGRNEALAINRGFAPSQTPGPGLGFEVGAHLYPFRWKVITFGIGGSFHASAADQSPAEFTPGPHGSSLRKKFRAVSPQLSFNFGGRNGWSYLSGGIGTSRLSLLALNTAEPAQRSAKTLNYGGGARWFISPHLAFSLDLRFYAISPLVSQGEEPGSPRMTITALSIGASFR